MRRRTNRGVPGPPFCHRQTFTSRLARLAAVAAPPKRPAVPEWVVMRPAQRRWPLPNHRALLVYPRFTPGSFWNYRATCEAVGARYSATPLGLITVAALLPGDWEARLVDRNVEELRDEDLAWADVVMTGGMMPQQRDTLALIARAHQ